MNHLTASWARVAGLDAVQHQVGTPLNYLGKFPGQAHRFFINDPAAPPWRLYKGEPSMGNFKGSDPTTVAFLDVFETADRVYIGFMSTRNRFTGEGGDYERRGLASRLVAHLYAWTDKPIVWGDLMDIGAERLNSKYRRSHPERTR